MSQYESLIRAAQKVLDEASKLRAPELTAMGVTGRSMAVEVREGSDKLVALRLGEISVFLDKSTTLSLASLLIQEANKVSQ